MAGGTLRTVLRRLHLAAALVFGLIFTVSGLTGSALAWMQELDHLLNPALFSVAPPPGAAGQAALAPLTVQRVAERLTADPAYGRPTMLVLPEEAGQAVVAWYRAAADGTRSPFALDTARQVMIDPYTLQVKGERRWGEIGLSRPLLMPTLFHLHRYLLAGEVGKTVIGIAGLALLLMAVVGLILWWPRPNWKALRAALTISHRGSWPRFNHSFHRSAGALLAPALIVLGFSGSWFNLPQWMTPVVRTLAPVSQQEKLTNKAARGRSPIPVAQAVQAAQERLPAARVSRVSLPAKATAPYEIRLRQPGEVRQGDGNTRIAVDAYSGHILRLRDPLHATGGDAFLDWLFPLHSGEAFGVGGRIAISIIGLAPAAFMLTGVALWLRRRAARRRQVVTMRDFSGSPTC